MMDPTSSTMTVLWIVGLILVGLLAIGLLLARLYRKASPEVALVRTGLGREVVVADGGCVVLPVFHNVDRVNMNTLRLEVKRGGNEALITKDRMRVDLGVQFYIRVKKDQQGIATAARTLGDKTFNVDALRQMVEGKLVDGLRAVGAKMTLDELHEARDEFVLQVQNFVKKDLEKNGLELESASLTSLDQTPFDSLDTENVFNAVGMKNIAGIVADSKKQRARIEAEAEVEVAQRHMEAAKRKLDIVREERIAALEQEREIEMQSAAQKAVIAERQSEADRQANEARIAMERQVKAVQIAADQEIALAEQARQIAISEKSREESEARARADEARALAARATETIETERQVAIADRAKRIALTKAEEEAQREAVQVRVAAEAERAAAEDRAEARLREARAEADSLTVLAEAKKAEALAEAEGTRAKIEAENAIDPRIVDMRLRTTQITVLPQVVGAMTAPLAGLGQNVRVNYIGGLNGAAAGSNGGGDGGKPFVNQLMDGLLGMNLSMPAVRQLGEMLGADLAGGADGILAAAAGGAKPATPPAGGGAKIEGPGRS